jgi:hypothetical protein
MSLNPPKAHPSNNNLAHEVRAFLEDLGHKVQSQTGGNAPAFVCTDPQGKTYHWHFPEKGLPTVLLQNGERTEVHPQGLASFLDRLLNSGPKVSA